MTSSADLTFVSPLKCNTRDAQMSDGSDCVLCGFMLCRMCGLCVVLTVCLRRLRCVDFVLCGQRSVCRVECVVWIALCEL